MTHEHARKLCDIITNLGGPKIQPEEIDWANDIPTGKYLLEWMSSQLLDELDEKQDEETHSLLSMRAIALEDEERRM